MRLPSCMTVIGKSTVWETTATVERDGTPVALETRAVAVQLDIAHDPTCGAHART